MIPIIIAISLLQACSFFEEKIEYEPFVKALDEGDMKKVMSASDDGYACVEQRGIYSTYEQKEDGEHRKTIYQTLEGIYNTKDKSLYGSTTQAVTSAVDSKDNKKEGVYRTNISYGRWTGKKSGFKSGCFIRELNCRSFKRNRETKDEVRR